jgi:hypothetical protein
MRMTDEAEARAILRGGAGIELRNAAASYVAPLVWGMVSPDGTPRVLHNGSAFFLRVSGPTLLVTAAHVIRQLEADRAAHGLGVRSQVGEIGFEPLPGLVDIDDSLDVATIRVSDDLPARVKKWVYQRPAEKWPPPPPMQGRGLFFAGFPGLFRTEPEADTLAFGLYGALLTATSVTDSDIVSQLDRDYVEPLPGFDPPPANVWLGGMSGAPGWTLTQVGWRLAGVLHEYSQNYELFYFRPAHRIRSDGSLVRTGEPAF